MQHTRISSLTCKILSLVYLLIYLQKCELLPHLSILKVSNFPLCKDLHLISQENILSAVSNYLQIEVKHSLPSWKCMQNIASPFFLRVHLSVRRVHHQIIPFWDSNETVLKTIESEMQTQQLTSIHNRLTTKLREDKVISAIQSTNMYTRPEC